MVARQIYQLKTRGITAIATTLAREDETSTVSISSLVDTWLLLRNVESNGERNRLLFVLRQRGSCERGHRTTAGRNTGRRRQSRIRRQHERIDSAAQPRFVTAGVAAVTPAARSSRHALCKIRSIAWCLGEQRAGRRIGS